MTSRPSAARTTRYLAGLTVVVILTAALLRAPILTVAPVARVIGDDLQVGAGTIGLLTTIPVLCFAVFAPLAIVVIRRAGADVALTITLVGIICGMVVRSLGGIAVVLLGTALIGAFATIGNVVVPMLIARDFSTRRSHAMTGVYTSSLTGGTMIVTLSTAPLADQWGWRGAVLIWAVFGVAALATWIPLRGIRRTILPSGDGGRAPAPGGSVLRTGSTWMLALAFAGQSFAFYAVTAWLPTLLSDQGYRAAASGAIASIFQLTGIAGGLLLPLLTVNVSIRSGVIVVFVAWLAVPLGFLFAPHAWLVWCVVGGLAQGAGITVAFIMINAFGGDAHTAAGRSGVVQGIGYAIAAPGALIVGALREATGAWTVPLLVVLAAVLLFGVGGWGVTRILRRPGAHAGG